MRESGCDWELGFLRVFFYTIVFSLIIVKFMQLRGRRQISEPRKYFLVRVIIFSLACVFSICFVSHKLRFRCNSLQRVSEPRVRFEWEQWQRKQERRLE